MPVHLNYVYVLIYSNTNVTLGITIWSLKLTRRELSLLKPRDSQFPFCSYLVLNGTNNLFLHRFIFPLPSEAQVNWKAGEAPFLAPTSIHFLRLNGPRLRSRSLRRCLQTEGGRSAGVTKGTELCLEGRSASPGNCSSPALSFASTVTNLGGLVPWGNSGFPFRGSVIPTAGRCWAPVLPLPAVVRRPRTACAERGDAGASPGILRGRGGAGGGGIRLNRSSGLGQLQIPRARGRSLVGTAPMEGWAGPPDLAGFSNKAAFKSLVAFRN